MVVVSTADDNLLRDTFIDRFSAGAVHNTDANPGPGIRVVVDTENKITVSGGNLVIASGKASPAWGDPGIWWTKNDGTSGFARKAGRTLVGKLDATSLISTRVGWDTNTSGDIAEAAYTLDGSRNLAPYIGGSTTLATLLTLANSTEYKLYVMLRSTGTFWLASGGAFGTTPVLVAVTSTQSTTTLYPALLANNPTALEVDDIIMRDLACIAPLASDTFSDASAPHVTDGLVTPSATDTPGRGSGLTWSGGSGFSTSGNALYNTPADTNLVDYLYFTNQSSAKALQRVTVTLDAAKMGGVAACWDSASSPANGVVAYYNRTDAKVYLDKYVAGVLTNQFATAATYSAGATLTLRRVGNVFYVEYNNVAIGNATISDAGIINNTLHGVYMTGGATSKIENYESYAVEYPELSGVLP